MTTLRTAAQQALEAMRCAVPTGKITLADWYKSITALKAALAEPVQEPVQDGKCKHCVDGCPACDARKLPVQEPVAWSYELATTMLEHRYDGWEHLITRYKPNVPEGSIRNLTPLFAAPPTLTDDQLDDIAVAARRGNLYDLRIAIERAHETGGSDD